MGKVKNWMMDMEEHIYDAIDDGAANAEDVFQYVQKRMPVNNKEYIKEHAKKVFDWGIPDHQEEVLTKEVMLERNVRDLETELHTAYTRIHALHDIINKMEQLAQKSVDNLIESIDTERKRWETEDE